MWFRSPITSYWGNVENFGGNSVLFKIHGKKDKHYLCTKGDNFFSQPIQILSNSDLMKIEVHVEFIESFFIDLSCWKWID